MQRHYLTSSALAATFLLALFGVVAIAHAESVLWNTTLKVLLSDRSYNSSPWNVISKWEYSAFHNPNITVTYHTRVRNADTGAVVACGSSVPVGTRLTLEFLPHKTEHISWSGTGGSFDTPYGRWDAGAKLPTTNLCSYRPEEHHFKTYSTQERGINNVTGKIYVTLSANPPTKTLSISNVTGSLPCNGTESSTTRTCTASLPGQVNVNFQFAATQAKFYARTLITQGGFIIPTNSCHTSNRAMQWRSTTADSAGNYSFGNADYVVNIPTRTISCPITIIEPPPENTAPVAPTVTSAAAGACVVGTPHTITMSATDPDGDRIRYLVDWDNDGTVDQFVPGSGYVNSGTSQTTSRLYAVPGTKTIRVRTEDEYGSLSAWQSLTFTCADSETAALNEGGEGGDGQGGFPVLPSTGDLSLRALPSLVRPGNTTQVHWSSQNMTACTVTGTNGDAWSTLQSVVNGQTSAPIHTVTTYTLTCTGTDGNTYGKNATVNILPSWREQ